MLKEEIKNIIQDAGFRGDNLDEIIDTSFKELFVEEKFQGFEGIFYHEYLQVLQWLSLVLIAENEENDENEEVEEGIETLIEKLRFFVE